MMGITLTKLTYGYCIIDNDATRSALKFFFSPDGYLIREFILEETCNVVDALNRGELLLVVVVVVVG